MKKIIFLLLLPILGFSQNQIVINQMANSNSLEQVKAVSDQIINSGTEKYIFYRIADSSLRDEKRKVALYTLASVTDSDQSKLSDIEKDNLVKVIWTVSNGEFTFRDVTASEDIVVNFWNRNFNNSIKEYRVNEGLRYKLVKNEKTYSIEKWY